MITLWNLKWDSERELNQLSKTKQKQNPSKNTNCAIFMNIFAKDWVSEEYFNCGRMQDYKTMKRNKISRRSKSTEWESMKAVPKVGNV